MESWLKRSLFIFLVSLGLVVCNALVISKLSAVTASTSVSITSPSEESKSQAPAIIATGTFTGPDISAAPPLAFQTGKNDLALLYLENNLLFRFEVGQQQSRVIAQVPPETVMSLSPNGQYLVYFSANAGTHLLNTLTGETSTLLDPQGQLVPTVWSRQNHLLVQRFYGYSECEEAGWFDPAEKVLHPYGETSDHLNCVSAAAWSNRGDRIVTGRWVQAKGGFVFMVQVLEVASGKQEYLVKPRPMVGRITSLDWSPDDRWAAVGLNEDDSTLRQRLYLKQTNGSGFEAVTNNQVGWAEFPVWGPDGALYYGLSGADTQADGLYRYSPANPTSPPLVSGPDLRPVDVSPDGEFLLYQDGPNQEDLTMFYFFRQRSAKLKLFSLANQQIISVTDGPARFVGWLAGSARQPAWRTHGADEHIAAITFEAEDHYWLATRIGGQAGLIEQDGPTRRVYTSAHGLVSNFQVNVIAIDSAGHKWVGADAGVSEFDGQSWRTFTTTHGLVSGHVNAIAIDPAGHKWFGTDAGVSEFDGQRWRTFTTTHGLVSDRINDIAVDPDGHKWFGTEAGVSEFDGQSWRTFTTTHGLAFPWVNAIAVDTNGAKWFATLGGGISRFDGAAWRTFTTADGLVSNVVYDLTFDDKGQLWAGTSGGVSKFDGTTWTTYTTQDGLLDDRVSSVTIAPDGRKWFGYRRVEVNSSLSEFDDSRWRSGSSALPTSRKSFIRQRQRLIDDETGRYYTQGQINGIDKTLILSLPEGKLLGSYDAAGNLALDSVHGWLYVDQDDNRGLAVFNTRTDTLQSVIRLPQGESYFAGLPAPQADPVSGRVMAFRDNVVYVADPENGSIVDAFAPAVIKKFNEAGQAPIEYATYDPTSRILYLDMIEDASSYEVYNKITYDLASGSEITPSISDRSGHNIFTAAGYAFYGGHDYDCRAAICTVSLWLWQAGRPQLQLSGLPYHDSGSFALDPTRQHLYEVTATHLRVYDLKTMGLIQHLPHAFRGDLARYDPSTDQLQFWVEDRLESWPVSAIQPFSPQPLTPSPVPTTSLESLVISPNWPADQTLFGLWPELSDDGYSIWGCGITSLPYLSHDGGQNWSQIFQGLPKECLLTTPLAVSPNYAHDQTLLAGIFGLGIFKSTDGGQLWLPANVGVTNLSMREIIISPGFARDKTVFALVATIEGNSPDTVYRSKDGGQTWQLLNLPLTADQSEYIITIAVSPEFEQDQSLLMALKGQDQRLYLSQTGGDQWELVGEFPVGARRLWAAPLWATWHTLFAATDQAGEKVLYRSADGGQSWQTVLTTPAAVRQIVFATEPEQNRPVLALADQLYQSPDGGLTWQEFELPAGTIPLTLAISPNFAQDRMLFVGTDKGEVLTLEAGK